MKQKKDMIYVVPAKWASIRLPEKNFCLVNGHPMIYYALKAIMSSGVDKTSPLLVSTEDCSRALQVLEQYVEFWFPNEPRVALLERPLMLAVGPSTIDDVVTNTLWWIGPYKEKYESLCVIQPDCPLIKAEYIQGALTVHRQTGETVVSGYTVDDTMVRSGMLFICSTEDWFKYGNRKKVMETKYQFYEIPWAAGLEVHTKEDIKVAERLLTT